MIDYFNFTKEDNELLGSVTLRDPLGLQVLWSTMGRKLIPHLTEQTTRVEGFQLLVTIFYLHERFKAYVDGKYDSLRSTIVCVDEKVARTRLFCDASVQSIACAAVE